MNWQQIEFGSQGDGLPLRARVQESRCTLQRLQSDLRFPVEIVAITKLYAKADDSSFAAEIAYIHFRVAILVIFNRMRSELAMPTEVQMMKYAVFTATFDKNVTEAWALVCQTAQTAKSACHSFVKATNRASIRAGVREA